MSGYKFDTVLFVYLVVFSHFFSNVVFQSSGQWRWNMFRREVCCSWTSSIPIPLEGCFSCKQRRPFNHHLQISWNFTGLWLLSDHLQPGMRSTLHFSPYREAAIYAPKDFQSQKGPNVCPNRCSKAKPSESLASDILSICTGMAGSSADKNAQSVICQLKLALRTKKLKYRPWN